MSQRIRKIALVLAGLAFSPWISAQGNDSGYKPPSSPELYDVNEPLVPAYIRVKKVKSHPYLGLGVSFGSSRLNGGDGTPKASWNGVLEGGYVKALTSWTRVDVGIEAFNGQMGNSRNSLNITIGALAKAGYGYNISENLYALIRLGYGLANARYSGKLGPDTTLTGSLWQLGSQLVVPTEASVDFLDGVFATQYGFAEKGSYNAYEGRIGLRLRL